jgi:alpha-L-rhamnosidase
VVPDGSWKTSEGAYVRNNVYLGVLYDASKEIKGWNMPGFADRYWSNAMVTSGPGGVIQEAFFPAVKIQKHIRPVDIRMNGKKIIVDLGINLTGTYRIKLKGETGDTIQFRFGERLYENGSLNPMTTVAGQIKRKGSGGPGAPDIAWQSDRYVFGVGKEVFFQPQFTFHTFRYLEISGLKYLPDREDVDGLAFHSEVENENHFECSNALLNKIQQACRQTFLNNLISVQSDCPARERFGYGGDLNATSEAFMDNFSMHGFYRKTVYDWLDAMQDSIFIDTAPFVGIKYCGISWESAFLTTQYRLLEYYGDTLLVDELYQKDLAWMDKVKRLHPDGLVEKGLSDHESMVKVPVQLIGTTHYLDCARIMKRFAKLQKDEKNMKRFQALEQSLTRKLLDNFWYRSVPDPINRQTLFATLIYYRLVPAGELPAAVDSLLKAVRREPEGHFTTGIFGTKYILEALSSTGHEDEVYRIVNSTAYPGWGYMADRGATTLWEAWKESDNTYSNCHPMFGSVSEWFYRWLAGIRPSEAHPGFKEFILSPSFPPCLNEVNAVYHVPAGDIKVNWKRDAKDGIDLTFSIPKGTTAHFQSIRKAQFMRKVTNVNTEIKFKTGPTGTSVALSEGTYSVRL